MNFKIILSPESERTYSQNIDYLLEKWTNKEAQLFIDKVNHTLSLLSINPEMGIAVKGKKIRKINAVTQVAIYYKIDHKKEVIEIITFWNNFQDPSKLQV